MVFTGMNLPGWMLVFGSAERDYGCHLDLGPHPGCIPFQIAAQEALDAANNEAVAMCAQDFGGDIEKSAFGSRTIKNSCIDKVTLSNRPGFPDLPSGTAACSVTYRCWLNDHRND